MKKIFNMVASICTIVLMGILLLGDIILLSAIYEPLMTSICVIILLFCIGTIVVAAIGLSKQKSGLKITVIILVGIIAILEFAGGGIVYGILCLIPVAFEITSICIKDKSPATYTTQPQTQTTDEKINELKHLKEINAITEEQYETAMNTLIEKLK